MPATFTAVRGAFTPSLTVANWTLLSNVANGWAMVKAIGWGGRSLQSKAYRTKWAYPTSNAFSVTTQITVQGSNPAVTKVLSCYSDGNPPMPADPISGLFALDWNSQGGEGYLNLPRNRGWQLSNAAIATVAIACMNVAGTDANETYYSVTWEE